MSVSKKIALAVSISWFSRVVSILSTLFLMPVLFRYMGKEELGLWFLLGNSQAFLGLLGMGIAPTLTRHIAFAKGKSGSDPEVQLSQVSKQHIGDLVVTGRIILQWLAVIVFFIAWVSGYGLISQLDLQEVTSETVFWAWTLMCLGYAIGVWVSYLNCWLAGIGYVGWDNLITTVLSLVTVIANIIAVLIGGGLLALAVISVVSGLIQRFVFLAFIRWRKPELFEIQGRWNSDYAKTMIKPSLYCWLTSLGAFLILRTDAYFIALLKGSKDLPVYQAGYSLVSNLFTLSTTLGSASAVFISQAWQAGNLRIVHQITLRNAQLAMSIMAAGVGFLLITGKELMDLWLGQGNFVGYGILVVFCIMLTLETQHVILVASSRATEDEKYAPWALTAGVLNVLFTWTLIRPLGLLGVAMGTMLAQICTNNWYAVYRPLIRLRLNFSLYCRAVISLWVKILLGCLSLAWLSKKSLLLLGITSEWYLVSATAIVCGGVFLFALWTKILEKHHQQIVKQKMWRLISIGS